MSIKRVYTGRNVTVFYQDRFRDFAEIAMSPQILRACMEVAEARAKPIAIRLSPVDEGTYIRSWQVHPGTTVVAGMRRVTAQLINTAPHAALVEWGGSRTNRKYRQRGHHVLQETRDELCGNERRIPSSFIFEH